MVVGLQYFRYCFLFFSLLLHCFGALSKLSSAQSFISLLAFFRLTTLFFSAFLYCFLTLHVICFSLLSLSSTCVINIAVVEVVVVKVLELVNKVESLIKLQMYLFIWNLFLYFNIWKIVSFVEVWNGWANIRFDLFRITEAKKGQSVPRYWAKIRTSEWTLFEKHLLMFDMLKTSKKHTDVTTAHMSSSCINPACHMGGRKSIACRTGISALWKQDWLCG